MSLCNILLDIASTLGLDDLTDEDRKQYYIDKINIIAEELYNGYDLPECLREHVYQAEPLEEDVSTEPSLLSLPYEVKHIRGIRYFNITGGKIDLTTLRPRYHKDAWGTDSLLKWRARRSDYCFRKTLLDLTPLTFTLFKEEEEDVNINIKGKTDFSDNIQESVIIPAGQLSVISEEAYMEACFEKLDFNKYNISVTDLNDEEISVIPNCLKRPYYQIVQFLENTTLNLVNTFANDTYEVLYKQRFIPFINSHDEFPVPNCDHIIFWKFAEWWESQQEGHEQRAILANTKAKELLEELLRDDDDSKDKEVNFEENRFIAIQRNSVRGYNRYPREFDRYTK